MSVFLSIGGALFSFITKLGPMLAAYCAGKKSQRADSQAGALKGISDAIEARDDSRADPVKRDGLRDKYRHGP